MPLARASSLDTSVPALLAIAGRRVPARCALAAHLPVRLRHREGRLRARRTRAVAGGGGRRSVTVHLGGAGSSSPRRSPTSPPVGCPTGRTCSSRSPAAIDPTRAPVGKHVLWTYAHLPTGSTPRPHRARHRADRALRPGLPRPGARGERAQRRGHPARGPELRRRGHRHRRGGPAPAARATGADLRPLAPRSRDLPLLGRRRAGSRACTGRAATRPPAARSATSSGSAPRRRSLIGGGRGEAAEGFQGGRRREGGGGGGVGTELVHSRREHGRLRDGQAAPRRAARALPRHLLPRQP